MSAASTAEHRYLFVTGLIPPGRVSTYGRVAELAGRFGAARQVGWVLRRQNPATTTVPWHRVVNASGAVSMTVSRNGTDWIQRELLREEGIPVDDQGRFSLQRYLWTPDPQAILEMVERC